MNYTKNMILIGLLTCSLNSFAMENQQPDESKQEALLAELTEELGNIDQMFGFEPEKTNKKETSPVKKTAKTQRRNIALIPGLNAIQQFQPLHDRYQQLTQGTKTHFGN